jgi:two-component system, LytTR family, response regulator
MQSTIIGIPEEEKHITLHSSKTLRFVKQHEIVYLQSENNYTNIYLTDKSCFLMCKTLKNYEALLDKRLFFRCHKSFLVNIFFIKEISKKNTDSLILKNGEIIPISRRKLFSFKKIMMMETDN